MADQRSYMINLINQIAPQYGVPVQLMIAVGMQESGLNSGAVGDGGNSHGAWQIHAPSHPSVSTAQAHDPVFSTNYAAKLLSNGYKKYGNFTDSVSSYNSGQPLPNAPASTQAYVKSIAAKMSGGQVAGAATGGIYSGGQIQGTDMGQQTQEGTIKDFKLPKPPAPSMKSTAFKIMSPPKRKAMFKLPAPKKTDLSSGFKPYRIKIPKMPSIPALKIGAPKTRYPTVDSFSKMKSSLGSLVKGR